MTCLKPLATAVLSVGLCTASFASDISVDSAWARAMPPGAKNSATYLTVHNAASSDRTIVAARADAAERVELHTVISEDGMMKMRQVAAIVVPANGRVTLEPGGFHIMMLGIGVQLKAEQTVAIEVEFADGEVVSFEAPVKKMASRDMKLLKRGE